MSRKPAIPTHDFNEMNAVAIADLVEQDIKRAARKWKYAHKGSTEASRHAAATEMGALYLQANHTLYFREEKEALRDAHQHWMELMREWFLGVVAGRAKVSLGEIKK